MLKLCAVDYTDGYAVYTQDSKTFMLRSPYTRNECVEVKAEAVGRAVTLHGFQAVEQEFSSLADLIAHLKQKRLEANPIPSHEELTERAKAALIRASVRSVTRFLNEIEVEMREGKEWQASLKTLAVLLENENLRQNPDLLSKGTRLLGECADALALEDLCREEAVHTSSQPKQTPYVLK